MSYLQNLAYFFNLPFNIQWRTLLVQLPRWVPLSILHFTSPIGPQPFLVALPSRKNHNIPLYVFVPPAPVDTPGADTRGADGEWKVPVVLDFHGGGFIMGSPLEQAPYAAMMSRELGAVVISVSYRIGPFSQFPAAIHDAEDVLAAILDTEGVSKAGKILRTEINRYHSLTEENKRCKRSGRRSCKSKRRRNQQPDSPSSNNATTITLDTTRLCISGFSAGGNIALNTVISVPPCLDMLHPSSPAPGPGDRRKSLFSPLLPPTRNPTILDDPSNAWPSVLPPPEPQSRLIPLLLFYPSLDARLLPHERPRKALPKALKGDDKRAQKPKAPGLFSIMGPTYLPKKMRAHPRASPGLVNPDNIQKNASILLVLSEKDSLAVQSDVWVDKMNTAGWNGPVRFGDGREGDWDGLGHGEGGLDVVRDNGGLEVWHAPECRHGWTQFPGIALGRHEKGERDKVFVRALAFVREAWGRGLTGEGDGAERLARVREEEIPPLRMPESVQVTENGVGNGGKVVNGDGLVNGMAKDVGV
ncbi:alpha/beta-hydrolase [Sporormia fimetaria CBS 119925]|uniref:Alpha/beta-hydrolase n=1 Tax=Sporormia fimetaria CBS 119925 TaxID=1340428 RepID=A0A6A6UZN3_9PLEO|nr:alpha/beta-hydrolase [Sporormia fimetaria CBS 119925]